MFGRKDKKQAEQQLSPGTAAGDFYDEDAADNPIDQVELADGRVIEVDTDEVAALYEAIITGSPDERAAAEARLREIEGG